MEKITIGSYIQQIRMDKGWSQDYLCSGICERSTLSRIENGQRSPSVGILTRLLERLGVSTERVIIMLDKGDIVMENLQKQVRNDTIRFEKAREEDKPAIRAQILADLDRLEEQAGEDERFIRQFILGARATVGGPEGPYSARERLQLLTEAIKLTVPRFSLKQIGRFRYSTEEMTLINQIARTYARSGDRKKSMDISRRLLQYIEENGQGLDKYARQFTLVAHNYAIDLGLEKRYEEAERLARRGWDICVTSGEFQFLAGFIAILAECRYFLGDLEESAKYYREAYTLYSITQNTVCMDVMRQEAKEHLGLELSGQP